MTTSLSPPEAIPEAKTEEEEQHSSSNSSRKNIKKYKGHSNTTDLRGGGPG